VSGEGGRREGRDGDAGLELGRHYALGPEFDLGGLKDEHAHFVRRQGERIIQSLKEPHLHNANLVGGVAEGICYAGVGDGGGVIPELHCNQ